jgi:hypothetical protein
MSADPSQIVEAPSSSEGPSTSSIVELVAKRHRPSLIVCKGTSSTSCQAWSSGKWAQMPFGNPLTNTHLPSKQRLKLFEKD